MSLRILRDSDAAGKGARISIAAAFVLPLKALRIVDFAADERGWNYSLKCKVGKVEICVKPRKSLPAGRQARLVLSMKRYLSGVSSGRWNAGFSAR